jgi:hypothetical protein
VAPYLAGGEKVISNYLQLSESPKTARDKHCRNVGGENLFALTDIFFVQND